MKIRTKVQSVRLNFKQEKSDIYLMNRVQNFAGILLISLSTFSSRGHANEIRTPCTKAHICTGDVPHVVAAKISACEAMVASSQCQSLGPNVKLRDCKSEAFCPYSLDQSYVFGCLIGAKDSVVGLIEGLVMAPITLLENAIDQTKFEAKYFNRSVYQTCNEAEETVAKDPLRSGLDCEKSFWRAACPRTLVRNCKDRLLEDFPDIKKSYGDNYPSVKYDKVVSDVRERLQKISKAKPTLASFLQSHSAQSVSELVTNALERQGHKFTCMSSYDVSRFSCDAVIESFLLVAGGYTAVSKIRQASKVVDGAKAANSAKGVAEAAETISVPPNLSTASRNSNSSFRPITVPTSVRANDVIDQTASDLNSLRAMGVKFRQSKDSTFLDGNVNTLKETKLEILPGRKPYYGKVLDIEDLPPPGIAKGPNTNAFFHPDMAAYKKKLEQMDYRLTVDTSTPFTGASAYASTQPKVVSIRPDSTWQTFLHEFQHAEFSHYIGDGFGRLEVAAAYGKSVRELMSPKMIQALGENRIKSLQRLLEKGLPREAVNETLSVEAELKVLGFRRYIPTRGTGPEQYALLHQITELNKIVEHGAALSAIQIKTLAEAKKRYSRLLAYDTAGDVAAGAAIGGIVAVPPAIAVIKDLKSEHTDPNSYLQIVYDTIGNILAQRQDGSWIRLQKK